MLFRSRVTAENISEGIATEPLIAQLLGQIESMSAMMTGMQSKIDRLVDERRVHLLAKVEKKQPLLSLPYNRYGKVKVDDATKNKAYQTFLQQLKNVDKVIDFRTSPYNYLVESGSLSNAVAQEFSLNKEQQREMFLSSIPKTSSVYKELQGLTLDQMFSVISTNSTSLLTTAEIDEAIDRWTIDLRDYEKLCASLSAIKALFYDRADTEEERTNHNFIFDQIARRLKREKSLPSNVLSELDVTVARIARESDPTQLQQHLLAVLKPAIRAAPSRNPLQVNKMQTLMALDSGVIEDAGPQPAAQLQQVQSGDGQDDFPEQDGAGSNNGNWDDRGCYQNQYQFQKRPAQRVGPWPVGKEYVDESGYQFTTEIMDHFSDACYRCGYLGHQGKSCRIFPNNGSVLTLCEHCRSGFHEVCKFKDQDGNYATNGQPAQRNQTKSRSNAEFSTDQKQSTEYMDAEAQVLFIKKMLSEGYTLRSDGSFVSNRGVYRSDAHLNQVLQDYRSSCAAGLSEDED